MSFDEHLRSDDGMEELTELSMLRSHILLHRHLLPQQEVAETAVLRISLYILGLFGSQC